MSMFDPERFVHTLVKLATTGVNVENTAIIMDNDDFERLMSWVASSQMVMSRLPASPAMTLGVSYTLNDQKLPRVCIMWICGFSVYRRLHIPGKKE